VRTRSKQTETFWDCQMNEDCAFLT